MPSNYWHQEIDLPSGRLEERFAGHWEVTKPARVLLVPA